MAADNVKWSLMTKWGLAVLMIASGSVVSADEVRPPREIEAAENVEAAKKALLEGVRERETKIRTVARQSRDAVVALTSEKPGGTGSGVIVSPDGLVLTAAHVTEALERIGGKEIVIIFPDGTEAKGNCLGANRTCDSAMVQITKPKRSDWPYVSLGDSDASTKGDWVVALGQPGGFELSRMPPVRAGRVWARDTFGAFFTDCTLVGGDSGGPLFDLQGKLLAIHSSIGGPLTTNRHVPVANFQADWDRLKKGDIWGELQLERGEPERPVMGVRFDEESAPGLKILSVIPDGPAEKAGLQEGDVLTHFAGEKLHGYLHFIRIVSRKKAGEAIAVEVEREKDKKQLTVGLVSARSLSGSKAPPDPEEPEPKPWFGAAIEDASPGVRVTDIDPLSPAEKAGLQKGDILTEYEGKAIEDAVWLGHRLRTAPISVPVKFKLKRESEEKNVTANLLMK